ncbi:MAG: TRAP transporter large permease [Planctomycetaceae bacterium]|nr:TRAP transporter large permease [Planctomycetaceae bacterium]
MALLFGSFFLLLILGLPIAFVIQGSSIFFLMTTGLKPLLVVIQRITLGLDSFPLLAIPLFILMGHLMEHAGLSQRLVDWVEAMCGRVTGALGFVAVVSCTIFAALTGSGPATVAAIGTLLIGPMTATGYPKRSAVGLIAAAGALGPVIPPSIVMIVYGTVMNLSIPKMFMAGILPGMFIALLLIVANFIMAKQWNVRRSERAYTVREMAMFSWKALPTLFLPVLILGGIYGGVFTPTEAATVGVLYSLVLGLVYRRFTVATICQAFRETVTTSSMVCFLVASANLFGWLLTVTRIPAIITEAMVPMLGGSLLLYWVFLIGILLIVGCLMESLSSVLILAPILIPIGLALGADELHLALVFCITLIVGFITPPFGANLFTAVSITKLPFEEVLKGVVPFLVVELVALLLLVAFPSLITWLPSLAFK